MVMAVRSSLLLSVVVLVCTSCSNVLLAPHDTMVPVTITTSIGGVIVDDTGMPLSGVVVSAHGQTTQTNSFGFYVFDKLVVPSERACVIARKNGHYTAAHAEWPSATGSTVISLTMQKVPNSGVFPSTVGGSVTVANARVSFPANAIGLPSGVGYSGAVTVGLSYLAPDSASRFATHYSGDALAQRADATPALLMSYGVLRVVLHGESGEPLQLRPGSTATIAFPIPASLASSQPSSIPLWYFDETIGMWKEEGTATLKGGQYVGTVTHFSDWNLDMPMSDMTTIEGVLQCSSGRPVGSASLYIGQVYTVTNEHGYYRCRVPASSAQRTELNGVNVDGMSAVAILTSPLRANSLQTVNIVLQTCPASIEGKLVNCSDAPIGGYVQVRSSRGIHVASTARGVFRAIIPSDEHFQVTAVSLDAQPTGDLSVGPVGVGALYDMGTIKACSGSIVPYTDVEIGSRQIRSLAYLNNGSTLALLNTQSLLFYDVASRAIRRTIDLPDIERNSVWSNMMFSADERVMIVSGSRATIVLDVSTGSEMLRILDVYNCLLSRDGKVLYKRTQQGSVVKVDVATGAELQTYSFGITNMGSLLGIQTDNKTIVSSTGQNTFTVWDTEEDRRVMTCSAYAASGAYSMCITPDASLACFQTYKVAPGPKEFQFIDMRSGHLVSSIIEPGSASEIIRYPYAISVDRSLCFMIPSSIGAMNFPLVRSIDEGSVRRVLGKPFDTSYAMAATFDPSKRHVVVSWIDVLGSTNVVRIYDL